LSLWWTCMWSGCTGGWSWQPSARRLSFEKQKFDVDCRWLVGPLVNSHSPGVTFDYPKMYKRGKSF
jgi:hypothetical protein